MIFADAPRRIDLKATATAIRRELGDARRDRRIDQPEADRTRARRPPDQPLLGRRLRPSESVDEIGRDSRSGRPRPRPTQRAASIPAARRDASPEPSSEPSMSAEGMDAEAVGNRRGQPQAPDTITMLDAKSKQGGGTGQRIRLVGCNGRSVEQRPIVLAGGLSSGQRRRSSPRRSVPGSSTFPPVVETDGTSKIARRSAPSLRAAKGGVST